MSAGRAFVIVTSLSSLVWTSGCATMFSSEKQDISVRASPQDASVRVDDKEKK